MSFAKITLWGMQQWMLESSDDLFANMNLPTGLDNSDLIDVILLKGGEFEVLYANPEFMKNAIGVWSNKWYRTFEKWVNALALEYNPIENYDRIETWSDAGTRHKSGSNQTAASSSDSNNTKSNSSDASIQSGKDETEHTVSAYDSSTYQPENKDKTDRSQMTSNASTSSVDSSSQNNSSSVGSDREDEQNSSAHTGRVHGNIGTLTTQQMLQSELDLAKFNLYEEAADMFLSELTIYIY